MQTKLKRLISAVLALAMVLAWYVPGTVSAEGTSSEVTASEATSSEGTSSEGTAPEVLFKENFGIGPDFSCTDWSTKTGVATANNKCTQAALDGTNTVLHVNLTGDPLNGNVDARFDTSGSTWNEGSSKMDAKYLEETIVYQFKFKPVKSPSFTVRLRGRYDSNGDEVVNATWLQDVFVVNSAKNEVKVFGTKISQAFEMGTWYDIALACNFSDGSAEAYINGVKVEGSFSIPSYNTFANSKVKFLNPLLRFADIAGNTNNDNEYYLDDIAVYTGSVREDLFAKAECFSENFAEGFTEIQGTSGKGIFIATAKNVAVTHFAENDGNHSLKVDTTGYTENSSIQINARYTPSGDWGGDNAENAVGIVYGKTVVYQFMIKINTNASFDTMVRTSASNGSGGYGTKAMYPVRVVDNVLKAGDSKAEVAELTPGKWYNIAFVLVYPENGSGTVENHVYLDGEYQNNYSLSVNGNDFSRANHFVRFVKDNTSVEQNFLLDNIAVYEAPSGFDSEFFGGHFTGNSVTLNAKLGVNFSTTGEGTVKVSNTYSGTAPVKATFDGEKHTVSVYPQYMMNEMTAGLYDDDGELIAANVFKLEDYINNVLSNQAYADYHELAEKTLQYCKAAAIYKEKYTEDGFSVPAVTDNLEAHADVLPEGVKTRLTLDDTCDLKIYIPANYADATLKIGGTEIGTVKEKCNLDSDGDYGYTVATEVLPQDYDIKYTVIIGDETCEISPLGWMQRYIVKFTQADDPLNQLVWALYGYHVAAQDFSGQD